MATKKKAIQNDSPIADPDACINCVCFLMDEPKDEAGYCRRDPKIWVGDEESGGWTYPVQEPSEWCLSHKRRVH